MAKSSSSTDKDVAFVKALAQLLTENDLSELEVQRQFAENDRLSVRVSKQTDGVHIQSAPMVAAPTVRPASPAVPTSAPSEAAKETQTDPAEHPGAVNSPMVGTVYLQAEPGAPSFISVGQNVLEGDTLVIIEAMKTMNHIPAPRAGTISRILVGDGTPVEFGAPLVILE